MPFGIRGMKYYCLSVCAYHHHIWR
jgi:hypothetical protein